MSNKSTKSQLINAEIATRARNEQVHKILEHHIPEEEKAGLKIDFTCECANPDCQVPVPLTLAAYDRLRQNPSQFIVAKGHNYPSIEKIKKITAHGVVVEKYALSRAKRVKDLAE